MKRALTYRYTLLSIVLLCSLSPVRAENSGSSTVIATPQNHPVEISRFASAPVTNECLLSETSTRVYVYGAAKTQKKISLCFPVFKPVDGREFMTKVLEKVDGLETDKAVYQKIYLFDESIKNKWYDPFSRKRFFDLEEMEFQRLGFIRARKQDVNANHQYMVLISTDRGGYFIDLISKGLSIATTFLGSFVGGSIGRK